jgi:hypothetical protein
MAKQKFRHARRSRADRIVQQVDIVWVRESFSRTGSQNRLQGDFD